MSSSRMIPFAQVFPPEAQTYKEKLKERKLVLMRCLDCFSYRLPHSIVCPSCSSFRFEWQEASGKGKIDSFVVFRKAFHESVKNNLPYIVAKVLLEEGVFLVANLERENDMISCDENVRIVWRESFDGGFLPHFILQDTSCEQKEDADGAAVRK